MLPDMPHAPPILILHALFLYAGVFMFVFGLSKTLKDLPGVIMSVIGTILIFLSVACFNTQCAEKEPAAPTPEQVEAAAQVQSTLADKKPEKSESDVKTETEEDVFKPRKKEKGGIRHSDYTGLGGGGAGCHYKE